VELTLHKLYRSSQHHLAKKRSVKRETSADSGAEHSLSLQGREPTPQEALAAAEELEEVLCELAPRDREAIELRLQGYEYEEIADRLHCHERTVRRAVNEARRLMAARGGGDFVPSAARQRPKSAELQSRSRERVPITREDAPLSWDDFVLHEQIGVGAIGRVYRATRKADGREFAIKFLRKSLTANDSALHRFLAEAKTVAELVHQNIVKMHGAGQTPGGGLFLLMDRVCGRDLQRVRNEQAIPIHDAVRWSAVAAKAVAFAHSRGVIHCDLKPSNLLLDDAGQIHVTDFGFAVRLAEASSRDSALAGTPAFMAPEQVDRSWGEISPRTDVWGLGGVLYFLLYGQPPHQGSDVPSTLANVVSNRPVLLPLETNQNISSTLRTLLHRSLAKSPSERIETAQQVADALLSIEK
jgi:serine/threonine protein kinase/DNA-binding CsgD family transcriptional regulator